MLQEEIKKQAEELIEKHREFASGDTKKAETYSATEAAIVSCKFAKSLISVDDSVEKETDLDYIKGYLEEFL